MVLSKDPVMEEWFPLKNEAQNWWYAMGRADERVATDDLLAAIVSFVAPEPRSELKALILERVRAHRVRTEEIRAGRDRDLASLRQVDEGAIVEPPEAQRVARLIVAGVVEESLAENDALWRVQPETDAPMTRAEEVTVKSAAREIVAEIRLAAAGVAT